MNIQLWLRYLFSLGAKVRRDLLPNIFRGLSRSGRAENAPAGEPASHEVAFRDGYAFHLLADNAAFCKHSYREHIAPLSRLMRETTGEELKSAIERLSRLHDDGRLCFPLDVYWRNARAGLSNAHEWAHLGVASREVSVNIFLPTTGEPGDVEDHERLTSFILYCSRSEPESSQSKGARL